MRRIGKPCVGVSEETVMDSVTRDFWCDISRGECDKCNDSGNRSEGRHKARRDVSPSAGLGISRAALQAAKEDKRGS